MKCPNRKHKQISKHVFEIGEDPKVNGPIHVRHMGDLSGGQMIKKRASGQGSMYEFDCDIKETKEKIRAKQMMIWLKRPKLCSKICLNYPKSCMPEKKETDPISGT